MEESSTWRDPAVDGSGPLPRREGPGGAEVDDWCAELVARVRPGGFAPASARPSADIAGRYRLLYCLGRGGVGEIWCAEHVGLGKEVAIKFLRAELAADPMVRRRFLREGRLAAAVRHPGVVDIFDVGEAEDGRVYLVMERLAGRSLAEVVEAEGPLPWPRARALLIQLAEALAYAHARGVVHRDLKPANVMLVDADEGGDRCKLIDFGLARGRLRVDESTELTRTGAILGSPAYMSPEQFRGEEADARSDIYSLGCVAHFLLAGQRPFDGTTPAQLMYQHLLAPLPRLPARGLPPGLAGALRRWLERACHKRPEQRFPDMQAALTALRSVAARPRWAGAALAAGAVVTAVGGVTLVPHGVDDEPPADDPAPVVAAAPRCGDGHIDPGERCDDGNAAPADGCELDCTPSEVVDVRAGASFTCVLTRAGDVRCWGHQGPQLGQPGHPGHIGDDELPFTVPPVDLGPHRVTQLGLEFNAGHVCVVLDDGTARCWGSDSGEQLGLGRGITHWGDAPDEVPARLPPLALPHPVRAIVPHEANTCALAGPDPERPGVYCWGSNSHGQLGLGDTDLRAAPPALPIDLGGAPVRELAVGVANTCVRFAAGAVRCWGGNRNLHLGTGWPGHRYAGDGVGDGARGRTPNEPALDVEGLEGFEVRAVRMNGGWACVLGETEVRCWGGNDDGALGERYDRIPGCEEGSHGVLCMVPRPSRPVELGDLDGARLVDLQMGRKRGCVLDDRGRVRCWGWGNRGSLGYGPRLKATTGHANIGHHLTPAEAYAAIGGGVVDVGDLDGDGEVDRVVKIALGYAHTCVLAVDGSVRCWGSNSEGELGYGTTEDIGDDETPGEYYAAHGCGAVPVFGGRGC